MIDVFNTPNNITKTQVFYTTETSNSWQTWSKPAGCSFVEFTVIGGGGGGGGARLNQGSENSSGGGGGGSSSITKGLFQASVLPDTLYIQVGAGGAGGAGGITGAPNGVAGSSGTLSYVSITNSSLASNILLASGAVAAGGGLGGLNTDVVAGGSQGTLFSFATTVFANLGIVNSFVGQAGSTSGNGTNAPTNVTISSLTTGGAGGAGGISAVGSSLFNGGSIIGSGLIPTVSGGNFAISVIRITGTVYTATATTKSNGSDGYSSKLPSSNSSSQNPMLFTGGGGGAGACASPNLGNGGSGGKGAYGSGGGGGGSNFQIPPPSYPITGRGGDGGDGIVIITCM